MKKIKNSAIKPAHFLVKKGGIAASILLVAGLSLCTLDTFAQRRGEDGGGSRNESRGGGASSESRGGRVSSERSGGNERVSMSRSGGESRSMSSRTAEPRGDRMQTRSESPRIESRGRSEVGRTGRDDISLSRPDRVQPDYRSETRRVETPRTDNTRGARDNNDRGQVYTNRDNDNSRTGAYPRRNDGDRTYGSNDRNRVYTGRDNNYGNRNGWNDRGRRDNDRYERRSYDNRRFDGRYGNPSWRYYDLPRYRSVVRVLPTACVPVYYGGVSYSYYNGIYYRPYRDTYVVAYPPIGLRINILPIDCQIYTFFGRSYHYYNGSYYRPIGNQYEVVPPPVGALVESIPDGYEQLVIDGETYYIVDGVQYKAVVYEGEIWFEVIKINY